MRRLLVAALVVVGVLVLLAAVALRDRPDLGDYREHFAPPAPAASEESGADRVTVTFLGVATLLFRDGETSILTDGFFSRPGLFEVVAGEIAPDEEKIAAALERLGVRELAAVIPVHSHYDHAMDAGVVARLTGAVVVGSESTANVARGAGVPESRIRVPEPGETLAFGRFRVRLLPSRHVDLGLNRRTLGGRIEEPLVPPARATDYAEGRTWSVWIGHPLGDALVQGSAGYVPGALAEVEADAVFLGVGGLGRKEPAYLDAYWREVVGATGARRVFPVHYDDFTRPLERPLPLFPRLLSDWDALFAALEARVRAQPGVHLALLPAWQEVVLFSADPASVSGS